MSLKILKNPNSILIQNDFYPNGLTEEKIYNYYQSIKNKIINEVKNREIILFINTDINQTIVRRYEILNNTNFDKLIHGRVVSIVSTMNKVENFGIIDIDYYDFEASKNIVLDIYNYLKTFSSIQNIIIHFTGKTSFHILVYFKMKKEINEIRLYLREILLSKFKNIYDLTFKRNTTVPNLDLSPNKFRGGFIAQYSLSTIGLRCMEIPIGQIKDFKKQFAMIS